MIYQRPEIPFEILISETWHFNTSSRGMFRKIDKTKRKCIIVFKKDKNIYIKNI